MRPEIILPPVSKPYLEINKVSDRMMGMPEQIVGGDVISKICRYLLAHSICGVIRGRKSIQIKNFHLASFSRPPRTPLGT